MTDLVVTAANVAPGLNAVLDTANAGAAGTAGQVAYRDAASGTFKLTDCDLAGAKQADGIIVNGSASGQPVTVQKSGQVAIGATLVKGTCYYASATAGGICTFADLVSGDAVILLGIAISASVLDLHIVNTGVAI